MSDIVFNDKLNIPDVPALEKALGETYSYFKRLDEETSDYTREWKFYNPKSGWVYKVAQKKKSLFYITPLDGRFNIGFAIRETEKEALLQENISSTLREKVIKADKYPEGYALRFSVCDKTDFTDVGVVLSTLIKLRA